MSSCKGKSRVLFEDQVIEADEGATVLEALENAGVSWPAGCRSGVCGSCKMHLKDGEVIDAKGKRYSKDKLENQTFLACSMLPDGDVSVSGERLEEDYLEATLKNIEQLADDIIQVTLQCSQELQAQAGQFLNICRDDGLQRCYSIAGISEGEEPEVELHVKLYQNGEMSGWLAKEQSLGSPLSISAPQGSCHYRPVYRDQNLLLLGTGTGLAPLYGVILEAIASNHQGRIVLYHGSRSSQGLYLHRELQDLEREVGVLEYHGCVSSESAEGFEHGRAHDLAFSTFKDLKDWQVFLCGHPEMVKAAQRMAYLSGVSMSAIHLDSFTPSGGAVVETPAA
jgi:NAD(P)H-flavin reductase